jgi:hypothetical protein
MIGIVSPQNSIKVGVGPFSLNATNAAIVEAKLEQYNPM